MPTAFLSQVYPRQNPSAMAQPHIFIVAVESSSDQLGAGLAKSLRAQNPNVTISAIGGPALEACGLKSHVDINGLSILGFTEAVRVYPLVLKRVKETIATIMELKPEAVVLIDSWGFMIRVAQGLKKAGYSGQIIKYVAPQVFAMREGRAKILANVHDHLLSIHSFDAPYFEKHGLAVTYVGNPMFDTDYRTGDAAAFKARWNIRSEKKVIGVMLGSRESEIKRLAPVLAKAAAQIEEEYDARLIAPIVSAIEPSLNEQARLYPEISRLQRVPQSELIDVMAAMDLAIACSGTITTQLASAGVPTVVAYKLAPLTYFAAKYLFKPKYISIVNIAAGQALMPEFIQKNATPEAIAKAAQTFLSDSALRDTRRKALLEQTNVMGAKKGGASDSAAEKILSLVKD